MKKAKKKAAAPVEVTVYMSKAHYLAQRAALRGAINLLGDMEAAGALRLPFPGFDAALQAVKDAAARPPQVIATGHKT